MLFLSKFLTVRTFDGEPLDFSADTFDRFVIVGEVVFDVKEVDSMVVNEENVLNRLLRLLEKDIEPSVKNKEFMKV